MAMTMVIVTSIERSGRGTVAGRERQTARTSSSFSWPTYVASEDIPKDTEGDAKQLCLLLQPFVRDESMTVADMVKETIRKTGENIRIRRFARFELGR